MNSNWTTILILIISCYILFACKSDTHLKNIECSVPQEVRALGNALDNWSFIEETDLSIYINDQEDIYLPKKPCYSFIQDDFTNDGHSDFICIMKNAKECYSQLVAFNNFKFDPEFIVIDGIADYGKYGIGNILYADSKKDGVISKKLESGTAFIKWNNNSYSVEHDD